MTIKDLFAYDDITNKKKQSYVTIARCVEKLNNKIQNIILNYPRNVQIFSFEIKYSVHVLF